MADFEDGASAGERLIGACRGNSTDLLEQLIAECGTVEAVTALLNFSKTPMGNYAYHEAALRGNYEIIDMLLDQEGFECDPICARDGNSPLHSAVEWINQQNDSAEAIEYCKGLLRMMVEAGGDPTIVNKTGNTALTLLSARKTELRKYFSELVDDYKHMIAAEAAAKREEEYAERDRIREAKELERLTLTKSSSKSTTNTDAGSESSWYSMEAEDERVERKRKEERKRLKEEKRRSSKEEKRVAKDEKRAAKQEKHTSKDDTKNLGIQAPPMGDSDPGFDAAAYQSEREQLRQAAIDRANREMAFKEEQRKARAKAASQEGGMF